MSKVINTVGGGGSGGSSWELLWTNPNPSANSWVAQTVSVDLANYNEIKIVFIINAASDVTPISNRMYISYDIMKYFPRSMFFAFYGGKFVQRTIPIGGLTNSGITFNAGQTSNSYGEIPSTANNFMIPYAIYGR